jgi:hypothetical protein
VLRSEAEINIVCMTSGPVGVMVGDTQNKRTDTLICHHCNNSEYTTGIKTQYCPGDKIEKN